MSRSRNVVLAALAGLALVGCASEAARLGLPGDATPADIQAAIQLGDKAFDHYLETDNRLQRISQTLRVAGAPLCEGEQNAVLGLALSGRREVPGSHRQAAERRFSDRRLRVIGVFDGLPAAKAGVKPGDVIESIGGRDVANFYRAYKASGGDGATIELRLERDGKPMVVQLERMMGCAYPAYLQLDDLVNAFAATELGYTVYTSALVRELNTDTLLAFVVGHEMAHNIINRLDAASPTSSRDHEARADYIGAYIVATAGYPISGEDSQLFNVLTRGDPNEIGKGKRKSHPMSSQRTLAFKQTVAEIRAKQARGEDVRPEVR
jgi:hypothetical protein